MDIIVNVGNSFVNIISPPSNWVLLNF
jgi:hypothetical protein